MLRTEIATLGSPWQTFRPPPAAPLWITQGARVPARCMLRQALPMISGRGTMAVDERSRFELHQRLGAVMGEEHAVTLIEQLTTADQIRELDQRVDERFAALERRMDERFQRVDERFTALEQRMDERLAAFEQRMDAFEQRMDERMDAFEQRMDERMDSKLTTNTAMLRTETATLGSTLRKEMGRQTLTTILGVMAANIGFAGIVLGLS